MQLINCGAARTYEGGRVPPRSPPHPTSSWGGCPCKPAEPSTATTPKRHLSGLTTNCFDPHRPTGRTSSPITATSRALPTLKYLRLSTTLLCVLAMPCGAAAMGNFVFPSTCGPQRPANIWTAYYRGYRHWLCCSPLGIFFCTMSIAQ